MFILLSCDDWRLLNRIWRRLDLGGIPAGWFFFKSPNQISCFNFSSGSQVVQSRDHDHTLSFYPFSTTTHHNIFPSLESYYFNAWAGANDLPPVFWDPKILILATPISRINLSGKSWFKRDLCDSYNICSIQRRSILLWLSCGLVSRDTLRQMTIKRVHLVKLAMVKGIPK